MKYKKWTVYDSEGAHVIMDSSFSTAFGVAKAHKAGTGKTALRVIPFQEEPQEYRPSSRPSSVPLQPYKPLTGRERRKAARAAARVKMVTITA